MRIVCISDTHEQHEELDVPSGDLLLHAGDFGFRQSGSSTEKLREFNRWLGRLPHRYKVVIPGNHDDLVAQRKNRAQITNATLLVNSGVEIEGIRIWGSPITALYGAFVMEDASQRKKHWAKVPMGTDILLTHGPAFGILDQENDAHLGDPELSEAIERVRPRLHVCGHVHSGYGTYRGRRTYHVNAALFDDFGGIERNPVVVDFEALRRES